jgi:two-component system CheB/CheR fusion protein
VLDLGMPGLNGYHACLLIRQQAGAEAICLVAPSSWGQREDLQRSHAAGFDRHLVKPLDVAALARLIAKAPSGMAS